MDVKVHKRLPSPRVALVGFEPPEQAELEALSASPISADNALLLNRPWDEIDLAVLQGHPEESVPRGIPILYRCDESDGSFSRTVDRWNEAGSSRYVQGRLTDAVEVHSVKHDLKTFDAAVERLASAPLLRAHEHFELGGTEWNSIFLTNKRNEVLAGEYRRGGDVGIGWVLPAHTTDMTTWLRLFLQRVHEIDKRRVPTPPPDWSPLRTAAEVRLFEKRAQLVEEFDAVMDDFRINVSALNEEIARASQEAGQGLGRLLTDDGDSLKEAVQLALTSMDFEVVDVDQTKEPHEGKREDLWVVRSDEVAIVEVKGYSKGASSGDLTKAKTYAVTYAAGQGSPPSGQWHVVNAFRGVDPRDRPRLFEGHDDLVNSLGILVLDTRDLFRLVRDAQLGKLTPEEARDLLWNAEPGFFEY